MVQFEARSDGDDFDVHLHGGYDNDSYVFGPQNIM
jgi:hypothetical protein